MESWSIERNDDRELGLNGAPWRRNTNAGTLLGWRRDGNRQLSTNEKAFGARVLMWERFDEGIILNGELETNNGPAEMSAEQCRDAVGVKLFRFIRISLSKSHPPDKWAETYATPPD